MRLATTMRATPLGLALTLALTLGGVSACGTDPAASTGAEPHVVASFYPLEFLARQVGGAGVTVENLVKPGTEPHDMELNPRQMATISEAGLVVYLKGFQPAVDRAVEQNRPKSSLDATVVAPLEEHAGTADEHAAEETAEEHAKEEHAGDPHVWLDPTRYAKIATALGNKLAEVDPEHAGAYRERAAGLVKRLQELDTEFRTGLAGCQRRDLVTSHTAFGYLAERYGLQQVGLSGLNPEAEPSPAHLAQVQRLVTAKGVTTIFFETLVGPKTAQSLARDTGTTATVLDPVEGVTDPAKQDYFSVMRTNLAALRQALGCR